MNPNFYSFIVNLKIQCEKLTFRLLLVLWVNVIIFVKFELICTKFNKMKGLLKFQCLFFFS